MNPVSIRQANKEDLIDLEWNGEYAHFRRLYADTYSMVQQGKAIIWIAEMNGSGLIGQCFVSLLGSRPELADGVDRAYIYGFRIQPQYRNHGIGTLIMRTIEAQWGLDPVATRDGEVNDLGSAVAAGRRGR